MMCTASSTALQYAQVWEVYVSQPSSKHKNKEKGAIATSSLIQAFNALAPPADSVSVHPASFQKQGKQKGKGQFVRCIKRKKSVGGGDSDGEMLTALDIVNVDSVDKVYRILTHHMKLEVSLRWIIILLKALDA